MVEIISHEEAAERGLTREEGRGSFGATADTQYYMWRREDGKIAGYSWFNYRTGGGSPVILDAQKGASLSLRVPAVKGDLS